MRNIKEIYHQRSIDFETRAAALRKRYNRLSGVRLLVFILAVGVAVYCFGIHWALGTAFSLLFIAAFYRFVVWHSGILENARFHERLARVNTWEKAALDHDYTVFYPGKEWMDPLHPYTFDLDIFGEYSLYQYLNRATTSLGRKKLATWLEAPAPVPEVQSRQSAVSELREDLDWRQRFQAAGLEAADDPRYLQALEAWLAEPPFIRPSPWLRASLYLAPIFTITGLLLWYFVWPWQVIIWFLLPAAVALARTVRQVTRTHEHTSRAAELLSFYSRLIRRIENAGEWKSPKLQELKAVFREGTQNASDQTRRLSYIIAQLNVRYNVFAIFLNLAAVWDLQWVYRLEKWKARERNRLPAWFDAMAEIEALASLANAWHNNPDWVLPVFHPDISLSAIQLGHPLIHPSKRVCNDISLPLNGHIKLVTGSNMAGKSTFLRTVGINAVLAQAGAPVCAQNFMLPSLQVLTSMRTQDALHESTSSFYAELKRLKQIIETVETAGQPGSGHPPVLFLLDEILKGTNSVDRHTGAKALILQLIQSKGSGFIATHDLELGALEATIPQHGAIENLCMEVEIRDGELFFDYLLKKGVSKSFNATLLMRNMGIRIG